MNKRFSPEDCICVYAAYIYQLLIFASINMKFKY